MHKFRVGQLVRIARGRLPDHSGGDVYEVVRLLPESAGEFGYRIKAAREATERAVRESELVRANEHR